MNFVSVIEGGDRVRCRRESAAMHARYAVLMVAALCADIFYAERCNADTTLGGGARSNTTTTVAIIAA